MMCHHCPALSCFLVMLFFLTWATLWIITDLPTLFVIRLPSSVACWYPKCVHLCSPRSKLRVLVPKVLAWHHCRHVFAISWTRQSRPTPCASCWHLLDCDDKCILSVPLRTNDLHYSRWQSGEIWQVLSIGAFTLFCHVVDGIMGVFFFFFSPSLTLLCFCLAHAFVSSMFPVFSVWHCVIPLVS